MVQNLALSVPCCVTWAVCFIAWWLGFFPCKMEVTGRLSFARLLWIKWIRLWVGNAWNMAGTWETEGKCQWWLSSGPASLCLLGIRPDCPLSLSIFLFGGKGLPRPENREVTYVPPCVSEAATTFLLPKAYSLAELFGISQRAPLSAALISVVLLWLTPTGAREYFYSYYFFITQASFLNNFITKLQVPISLKGNCSSMNKVN